MFKKQDDNFDEMAADPVRRRATIANLSRSRTLIGCCALVISVCAIVGVSVGGKGAALGVLGVFAAAVNWSVCFKLESDLRLLRAIERLHKGTDEKPMA